MACYPYHALAIDHSVPLFILFIGTSANFLYYTTNLLICQQVSMIILFAVVGVTDSVEVIVDQAEKFIEGGTLLVGHAFARHFQNSVDLFGQLLADLSAFLRQAEGIAVAFVLFRSRLDKTVCFQVFDGAGDRRFVLVTVGTEFCGGHRLFRAVEIVDAGNVGAFQIIFRHFLGLYFSDSSGDARYHNGKRFKAFCQRT